MTNKVIKISQTEAIDYCVKLEDDFFDRKSEKVNGAKLQELAVAFANAEGGCIIVGIEDERDISDTEPIKRWKGKERVENYNGLIQALAELNGVDFTRSARQIIMSKTERSKLHEGYQIHG